MFGKTATLAGLPEDTFVAETMKKMKKRITFSTSGNGTLAAKIARELCTAFNSTDIERIAALIATACKDTQITITAEETVNGVIELRFVGKSVKAEKDTLQLNADNVEIKGDTLTIVQ